MLKKIFSNILLVFLVIFILDFAIGKTLRYFYFNETSGLHYRTTYSMDSTNAEILIFGSSRANHHYVPEIFEDSLHQSFYNTGRDGNGTFYQLALVKTILKRYTPKTIIFEYSSVFAKGVEEYDQMSSLLPYYKTHKEIRPLIELRSPYEKIKLLSEIYPFNSQALTIAVGNLEINKKRTADDKGYLALHQEWPYQLDSIADEKKIEVDTTKVRAFRECLSTAKNMGIKVYVVFSPIYRRYKTNQQVDICRQICHEQNIPFWDYSKDSFFLSHRNLFLDLLHLNNNGAVAFSKMIANKIKHYKTD